MFNTDYSLDDQIQLVYSEETSIYNCFRIIRRSADSKLQLEDKRFHLECESNVRTGIAVRMFEYDWMEAVNNVHDEKGISEERGNYVVRLQNSGILFLRSTRNTPDCFKYRIILPGEREVEYEIPIAKSFDYTLVDIFTKELYILLPFYLLQYEKRYKKIRNEKKNDKENELADLLATDLEYIYNELNRRVQQGDLEDYERNMLCQLMWSIGCHIFHEESVMRERMAMTMGGRVLEFDWDIEYRKQMQEARELGQLDGANHKLVTLICRKLSKGKSVETIAEELEEELSSVKYICEIAKEYEPNYEVDLICKRLQSIAV